MRTIRLTLLAVIATLSISACSSPTAANDDCAATNSCEYGHPGSGN